MRLSSMAICPIIGIMVRRSVAFPRRSEHSASRRRG
jgi:hypothetical protein